MQLESVGSPILWIGFVVFILGMLGLDLGVFHRKAHTVRMSEALIWTGVWIGLAMLFNLGVYLWFGEKIALEFLTGYLIEKSLSVDNIFVFLVIFSAFAVPSAVQHRVLFWGIIGALLMRALLIVVGAALIQNFHWVMYVFGALLVITGLRLLFRNEGELHPDDNRLVRLVRRFVPMTDGYRDAHFSVVEKGRRLATPLLLVLIVIEMTDLVFAVDSIPAIFAITTDPFIVFTSNIFAILGLRSMYFLLASVLEKLRYLKVGLALVLMFVGTKMLIMDIYKIPILISLSVVATLIGGSIVFSLLHPGKQEPQKQPIP